MDKVLGDLIDERICDEEGIFFSGHWNNVHSEIARTSNILPVRVVMASTSFRCDWSCRRLPLPSPSLRRSADVPVYVVPVPELSRILSPFWTGWALLCMLLRRFTSCRFEVLNGGESCDPNSDRENIRDMTSQLFSPPGSEFSGRGIYKNVLKK